MPSPRASACENARASGLAVDAHGAARADPRRVAGQALAAEAGELVAVPRDRGPAQRASRYEFLHQDPRGIVGRRAGHDRRKTRERRPERIIAGHDGDRLAGGAAAALQHDRVAVCLGEGPRADRGGDHVEARHAHAERRRHRRQQRLVDARPVVARVAERVAGESGQPQRRRRRHPGRGFQPHVLQQLRCHVVAGNDEARRRAFHGRREGRHPLRARRPVGEDVAPRHEPRPRGERVARRQQRHDEAGTRERPRQAGGPEPVHSRGDQQHVHARRPPG